MNDIIESFGRKANRTQSISTLFDLEQAEERCKRFTELDSFIGELLVYSLRGQRLATMTQEKLGANTVTIHGLSAERQAFMDRTFRLEHQQSRGAWFLPTEASLKVGVMNLPWAFQKHCRFASSIVWEERGKISLTSSADVVLVWAVLEPLFQVLFLPFELRGRLAGTQSREEQLQSWEIIDTLLGVLGFEVSQELAIMRYGGGWHKLGADAQLEAKKNLLEALACQVEPTMSSRYRAYRIQTLVKHYYKKAKKDGCVKRKQALTKPLARTLSGFFGGDWLAFLDYIGERPHPDEQIVTALPDIRLHVADRSRAMEVAAQTGIPVKEVERMLAAYWQQDSGASPVEQRAALLEKYWSVFDEIHTRQAVGMAPLWGLLEDYRSLNLNTTISTPYQPGLYRQLLPKDMVVEIERLWGTIMLPRWPERIVSEPFPHALMAETLGPALKFWHGCALTAWFLCEGPYSRTDMSGLSNYYRKELAALESLHTPINSQLFDELEKAESCLEPPQPIYHNSTTTSEMTNGISFTLSTSIGSRRAGFEKLRDIITHYRRSWTREYFSPYLRVRWESDIREAGRAYNVLLHEKGKAPTLKQFAKSAATATNYWFGGDVSGLYGAIREKSPIQPCYLPVMPSDKVSFAKSLLDTLRSNCSNLKEEVEIQGEPQDETQAMLMRSKLEHLTELSLWYMQLQEVIGRSPELKEFGVAKFEYHSQALSNDVHEAWCIYSEAIQATRKSLNITVTKG